MVFRYTSYIYSRIRRNQKNTSMKAHEREELPFHSKQNDFVGNHNTKNKILKQHA